ncbi:hypothetical protein GCM10017781_16440 [Deinococcus metalli]|uniref:Uncharacterized protein n=1 Tax=Deinococcus metalli TaxID=1141878 RepID=A0ABQ3JR19_9DEIO|nr:hypothetical protein GCM10017781_16440 [Deinococcus metalli]
MQVLQPRLARDPRDHRPALTIRARRNCQDRIGTERRRESGPTTGDGRTGKQRGHEKGANRTQGYAHGTSGNRGSIVCPARVPGKPTRSMGA